VTPREQAKQIVTWLEEEIAAAFEEYDMTRQIPCSDCGGRGKLVNCLYPATSQKVRWTICGGCYGSGWVPLGTYGWRTDQTI